VWTIDVGSGSDLFRNSHIRMVLSRSDYSSQQRIMFGKMVTDKAGTNFRQCDSSQVKSRSILSCTGNIIHLVNGNVLELLEGPDGELKAWFKSVRDSARRIPCSHWHRRPAVYRG